MGGVWGVGLCFPPSWLYLPVIHIYFDLLLAWQLNAVQCGLWKPLRNDYSLLLLEAVITGHFRPPFNSLPPDGGLPRLGVSKRLLTGTLHITCRVCF